MIRNTDIIGKENRLLGHLRTLQISLTEIIKLLIILQNTTIQIWYISFIRLILDLYSVFGRIIKTLLIRNTQQDDVTQNN
jgi:hypothetical protein